MQNLKYFIQAIIATALIGVFLPAKIYCLEMDYDNTLNLLVVDAEEKDSYDDPDAFFVHQKNYVPGESLNQAVKTIKLGITVWQDAQGKGTFPRNDFIEEKIVEVVQNLNRFFSRVALPVRPIEGVDYLRDSHVRFELGALNFIQNDSLYKVGCGRGNSLNNYLFEKHPQNRQFMNIHLVAGHCVGASGYASFPTGRDLEQDSFVVSYVNRYADDPDKYSFWALMLHLAHELGHNFDLRHPYNSEYCRFSHPDFLFDLFGFEQQDWCDNPRRNCDICYHDGGWNCDLRDPNTTCTNNIMGGNRSSMSITPLQMGRINRSLALTNVRKYAWGYSHEPFRVTNDQTWSFNKKFYQDIVVESGATLIITGTLEMVPEAGIIVKPGSKLIIDGGLVTSALYSPTPWQGVITEEAIKPGLFFWRKPVEEGKIILENNGKLENYRR